MQPSKKLRRPPCRERPRQLAKQPLGRLGQQFLAAGTHVSQRLVRDGKIKQRRLPRRPQRPHGVFREVLRDSAHAMLRDVLPPAIRVEQLSVRQLPRHAVHRRVAAVEVFLDCDLGRKRNIEAAVPRPRLALAPRKGDFAGMAVDGHEVDGKRTADTRRVGKHRTKIILGDAAHDIVLVSRRYAAQFVPHKAADKKDPRPRCAELRDKFRLGHKRPSLP